MMKWLEVSTVMKLKSGGWFGWSMRLWVTAGMDAFGWKN
jgi:hypothetical protein